MKRTDEPCTIFVQTCTVHRACLFLLLLVFEFKLLAASITCHCNPAPISVLLALGPVCSLKLLMLLLGA